MWKAVYVSERGTAHKENRTPCQDSCRVRTVDRAGESFLVAVCADGAGSASHAHIGADLACLSLVRHLSEVAHSGKLQHEVTRDDAIKWCESVREKLLLRADRLQIPARELACTLLAAVVGESGGIFLQIGDGAMVVSDADDCEAVFWPQSGEYANTTNFLTDAAFKQSLEFCVRRRRIDRFAAFTDGLERLILHFNDRTVHAPALLPMLDTIGSAEDVQSYFQMLRGFLRSEAVNDRTNDDKTLILAVRTQDRREAEEAESHPIEGTHGKPRFRRLIGHALKKLLLRERE